MLKVNWDKMTEEEKEFVNDLIRSSVLDNAISSEADALIAEGVIDFVKGIDRITDVGDKVLCHICNERCKIAVGDNMYRCRKLNNLKITTDNTKHVFKPLPNDHSIMP